MMNPALGASAIYRALNEPREHEQLLQEYQRNQPAVQAAADTKAVQDYLGSQAAAAGTQENLARASLAAAQIPEAQAETKRIEIETGREQGTAKANALQQMSPEWQSGAIPQDAFIAKWSRIAQANPFAQITPEDIQRVVTEQPSTGVQVAKIGDVPASVTYQGQVWGAGNISTAPAIVQNAWKQQLAAYRQNLADVETKERRVAGFAAERQAAGFGEAEKRQQEANRLQQEMKGREAYAMADEVQGKLAAARKFAADSNAGKSPATNDYALTMNSIGGTLGAQRGARMTMAEVLMAGRTRSLPGDLQVFFDKVITGQSLSEQQRKDMVSSRLQHR